MAATNQPHAEPPGGWGIFRGLERRAGNDPVTQARGIEQPLPGPAAAPSQAASGPHRAYLDKAVNGELGAIRAATEGARNDQLNRSAYNLGQLGQHLDEALAVQELIAAGEATGLEPAECRGTVNSGWRSGAANPRAIPPRQPPAAAVAAVAAEPAETAVDSGTATVLSWRPVDLTGVLTGHYTPPAPSVGRRADGQGIFYPGKMHTVSSESEAGKTWFALAAVAAELEAGAAVIYIDFEDNEGGIAGRLLSMGTGPERIGALLSYIRPNENIGNAGNALILAEVIDRTMPTLVIIDGITEAMVLHGLEPLANKDIAEFARIIPRWISDRGPAVVMLDHVTKNAETRGRYALGGVHKLNAVDGAAFILENRVPFGIGRVGKSTVSIAKDRPGELRKVSLRRKEGGLFWFADLVIDSERATSHVEVSVVEGVPTDSESFRPTVLMAKIVEVMGAAGRVLSQREIEALCPGHRLITVRGALALLINEGVVEIVEGPRGARLHVLREDSDDE